MVLRLVDRYVFCSSACVDGFSHFHHHSYCCACIYLYRLHSLLQHPRYRDRVVYLQGSPWNSGACPLARYCVSCSVQTETQKPHLPAVSYIRYTADLARACAGQAQAIFVTASFEAADIVRDSDRILLTAVAARKYLIRYVFVQFSFGMWAKCVPYVVVVDMH